jgi:hypothetical protein
MQAHFALGEGVEPRLLSTPIKIVPPIAYSWAQFPTARSGRPNGRMISGEGALLRSQSKSASLLQGKALVCADRSFFQKRIADVSRAHGKVFTRLY